MTAPWLARPGRGSYIAALSVVLWAGCRPTPRPVPEGPFQTVSRAEFARAAGRTVPDGREIIRFRWRSEDSRISLSGNGAARLAPPDSLRVDLAASLGVGRSTVILTGGRVQAQPEEVVAQILPDRFALWTALGIVQVPDAVRYERLVTDGTAYWRATDAAGRVTVFEMRGDTLLAVTREEGGRLAQRLRLERGADGRVRRARLEDHVHGARLAVDISGRESSEGFPEAIWQLDP